MNNRIAIKTYISIIESKKNKIKKQNRNRLIDTGNILVVAR